METAVTEGTHYPGIGHLVQFYGHEEELADQVAEYLLGALDDGGVAVVIATPRTAAPSRRGWPALTPTWPRRPAAAPILPWTHATRCTR